MPERGFTFLPRAVIPIMGLESGTKTRLTGEDGEPTSSGSSGAWGLGDTILRFFFAPHTNKAWKWGAGPQFSLSTHTDKALRGPEWGAGVAGVVVGDITEQIAFAGIIGNHWSFDGNYNSDMIQAIFYYNFASLPGD